MTTITQTIPSLGSPPLTSDPANFDSRADTLYGTSLPAVISATNTWSGQVNTVSGEVNTNATNAAASASSATSSASSATASASAASGSASSASASASTATTAANNAAASYDLFDDRFLGAKASDPSVDNDGNALVTGAIYFNTSTNAMRVYNGAAFQDTAAIATTINLATQTTGTLTTAKGGTGSTSTQFANLTTNVTGTLPIANGGTGLTALGTAAQVLAVNSGASALEYVSFEGAAPALNIFLYQNFG
jgi:hypothetical protein